MSECTLIYLAYAEIPGAATGGRGGWECPARTRVSGHEGIRSYSVATISFQVRMAVMDHRNWQGFHTSINDYSGRGLLFIQCD